MRCGLLLLIIGMLTAGNVLGQGTDIRFGRNRVQHKEFDWRYYKAEAFDIYFYTGGRNLARFAGRHATQYLEKLEDRLDYRARNRLTLIIYNSYADLRQTNIGYTAKKDNPNGVTPIVDNHAFVYYNGDHFDLLNNIRESIARVLMNEMLYGGGIQERVQNSTLLNLPDWYLQGLADYLGNPLSPSELSRFRDGILSGKYSKFQQLTKEEKVLISQFIWRYIATSYGKSSISNILYLNKVNKSLESGFAFVLGKDYNELYEEWYRYYRRKFDENQRPLEKAPSKPNLVKTPGAFHKSRVTSAKLGPKGEKLAYVTNNQGRKKVWIYNTKTQERNKVYREGHRAQVLERDYNYPLIAWHPRRPHLMIVDNEKDIVVFKLYNGDEDKIEKRRKNFRVEKVLDMSYGPRGNFLALSAIDNGRSDIYLFNWQTNSMRPITRDPYDDLHPRFTPDGKALVFSSNRYNDTIKRRRRRRRNALTGFNTSYDIFYYKYRERGNELKRLTYTPLIDEFKPNAYDTTFFSYLTARNGIINRSATRLDSLFQYSQITVGYEDSARYPNDTFRFAKKDSSDLVLPRNALSDDDLRFVDTHFHYKDTAYTYALTNRRRSIKDYQIDHKRKRITEFYKINGDYRMAQYPLPDSAPANQINRSMTGFGEVFQEHNRKRIESPLVSSKFGHSPQVSANPGKSGDKPADTSKEVDINDYYFQSEFADEQEAQPPEAVADKPEAASSEEGAQSRRMGRARNYYTSFTPNYLQTQLDNSIINTRYLPYDQDNPESSVYNPVLNAMTQMGISDLFQDYRITGGFRVLGNLQGADYFLRYQNLKQRLDKKWTFFRHGEKKQQGNRRQVRETSYEIRYSLKWPFSEVSAIKGDIFARRDNNITLSSERRTLEQPNDPQNWLGLDFEYVFDNTLDIGKNTKSGTRFKVYLEGYRGFNLKGLADEKTSFGVVGGDFRNYIPIFRDLIWANRLAFASSFGQAKVVYFMGGTDSWLFPQFNDEVDVSDEQNYVYKSPATNMRGFDQNIRNGNSYTVFNSELRIPVFRLFNNKPVISPFFNNFQLIAFGDIGSAWTGLNPFKKNNALNEETINRGPLEISVINLSNPFVAGYGFGVRTNILGYFVRMDYAWGVENNLVKNRGKFYLSLGLDF